MRAKFVRGKDPKEAMGIGMFNVGDEIEILLSPLSSLHKDSDTEYFVQPMTITRVGKNGLYLDGRRLDTGNDHVCYRTFEEIERDQIDIEEYKKLLK